jgi:hypothetical protein
MEYRNHFDEDLDIKPGSMFDADLQALLHARRLVGTSKANPAANWA